MIIRVRDLINKLKEFDEDLFVLVHTVNHKRRSIHNVVMDKQLYVKIELKGRDNR